MIDHITPALAGNCECPRCVASSGGSCAWRADLEIAARGRDDAADLVAGALDAGAVALAIPLFSVGRRLDRLFAMEIN
jgi:hypothetical protein